MYPCVSLITVHKCGVCQFFYAINDETHAGRVSHRRFQKVFMQESTYLGTKKIGRQLRKFAIPLFSLLLLSCLYNTVDRIFVGNGIGYLSNAATGVIFPINLGGLGRVLILGAGAAAALSMSLGRRETKDIHKIVGGAILSSFLEALSS